jgi:hypothetical protein
MQASSLVLPILLEFMKNDPPETKANPLPAVTTETREEERIDPSRTHAA